MMRLAVLMHEHRGALEYDWRARFHLPLTVIGDGMGWGEAVRLVRILANDPSSQTVAAVSGWSHPFGWESILLADLFDVQLGKASKRHPKPWPRPWQQRAVKSMGTAVSVAEFRRRVAEIRSRR